MTARKMRNQATSALVSYQLSNTLDGVSWGDGSGVTVVVTGTGNGSAKSVTVYGLVPAQNAAPGTFKDTVTAVVSF